MKVLTFYFLFFICSVYSYDIFNSYLLSLRNENDGILSCSSRDALPITWTSPLSACALDGNVYNNSLANSGFSSYFQCLIKNFGKPNPNIGFNYPGTCGCPNHCSNRTTNGECINNQCECFNGWTGPDCSQITSLNPCSNNGTVGTINNINTCICNNEYSMNDCSAKIGKLPPILQTITPVSQYTNKDDYGNNNPLFNSSTIAQIHLTMPPEFLTFQLEPINRESDTYFPSDYWYYNGIINDTLNNVGFRLKGGASRGYVKKTWKLSFNKFESGRKIYQQKKLALKALEQDESAIKEILVLSMLYSMNSPAQRYGYTQLFINEQNMGAYLMIENVDDQFLDSRFGNDNGALYKCLGDLEFLGLDPELYANTTLYEPKTSAAENFDLLRDFITILNVTSDEVFIEELPKIFDVDLFLRTLVVEVLSGNFDGIWNANNYYLYYNFDVNKFQYFRHDVSSSFGVFNTVFNMATNSIYTWGDGGRGYRLINRVLANEPFRGLYTHYMNELLHKYYSLEGEFWNRVLSLNNMITPLIYKDEWRMTDFAFSFDGFKNLPYKGILIDTQGIWPERGLPYLYTYGIKEFMQVRIATAKQELEF